MRKILAGRNSLGLLATIMKSLWGIEECRNETLVNEFSMKNLVQTLSILPKVDWDDSRHVENQKVQKPSEYFYINGAWGGINSANKTQRKRLGMALSPSACVLCHLTDENQSHLFCHYPKDWKLLLCTFELLLDLDKTRLLNNL